MKARLSVAVALAVAAVVAVGSASGAPGGGKLRCFADAPATCTLNSPTSATIDTTGGGDAGVYLSNGKSMSGVAVADADFSFTYFCADTVDYASCTGGGAVRWSIPINTGDDSKDAQNVYAFLDAANCGNTGSVSTSDANCPVFLNTGPSYANWDAFAAANPTYTIAGALPFVISDVQTASQAIVSNVIESKS